MKFKMLNDFVYSGKVDDNCIRKYSEKIPQVLMDALKGSYFGGNVSIPVLVTVFGDVIT